MARRPNTLVHEHLSKKGHRIVFYIGPSGYQAVMHVGRTKIVVSHSEPGEHGVLGHSKFYPLDKEGRARNHCAAFARRKV